MDEYIEREKVDNWLLTESASLDTQVDREYVVGRLREEIPAADVRPVKRGKWTLNKDGSGTCSECGRTQKNCWDLDNWDNFCHFCGADMREVME